MYEAIKFYRKKKYPTPGEPQKHHLGEVRPKKFKLHRIFIKDKMNVRKSAKKVNNEVKGPEKNISFDYYSETFKNCAFLCPVTSILTFFAIFLKNVQEYIAPSSHIESFCSSNFYNFFFLFFFFAIYKSIILIFY